MSDDASHATFASVCKTGSESWEKLEDDHPFSKLQSAFWGKKIEDDAKRWRELQSTVEDDEEADIGPGCYALNLGEDLRLKDSKLWVRQDYIRIYDYCTSRREEGPRPATEETKNARSVVINGQRGVGKTHWVTYAARRRLGEKNPFLLCEGRSCFLFVKDGVFEKSIKSVSGSDFAPFLWAFMDGGTLPKGIRGDFLYSRNLYFIFTMPPEQLQWRHLSSLTNLAVITMNPWSLGEILLAAEKVHGFTGKQLDLVEAHFKTFGPIPQTCINFIQDSAQQYNYENRHHIMVASITPQNLRRFVLNGINQDPEKKLHLIFLIKRNEPNVLEEGYLEPISAHVARQLMMAINQLSYSERINLYQSFTSEDMAKGLTSLTYESLCLTLIQRGVTLTLKPLIKTHKQNLVYWKAKDKQMSNSMDMPVDNLELEVSFPHNIAIIHEDKRKPIQPNHLCISLPKANNQGPLHFFLQLDSKLYIFKFAVTNNHNIQKGIDDFFAEQLNILPPKTDWHFVFITPPGCNVNIKATQEAESFLEEVMLCSAYLEIVREAGTQPCYQANTSSSLLDDSSGDESW